MPEPTPTSFDYDANGNVSEVVKRRNAVGFVTPYLAAYYEYDPFGNTIRSTGTYADANLFRFSTKYFDPETTLYYYGFRYYDPVTGRWPSRDPIGEAGGLNRYGMVSNDSVNAWDYLGKWSRLSPKNNVPSEGDSCTISDSSVKFRYRIYEIASNNQAFAAGLEFKFSSGRTDTHLVEFRWWTCSRGLYDAGPGGPDGNLDPRPDDRRVDGPGQRCERTLASSLNNASFPSDINVQVSADVFYLECECDENTREPEWKEKMATGGRGDFSRPSVDAVWNWNSRTIGSN